MFDIKFHRVWGVILRHIYSSKHSFTRLVDVIFWPVIDLLLWGITASFIESQSDDIPNIVLMILSGIIFWMIVYRMQNLITVSLLEDFWNKSFMHYFLAPTRYKEFILGIIGFSLMKLVATVLLSYLVAFVLYKLNIFTFGWYLVPFVFLLTFTGLWFGLFVLGIILRYGSKVEILAWSFIMILAPFSAVYYPVSALPEWAQTISLLIPTSYIFEGMREVINTGSLDSNVLIICFFLNCFYMILSVWYLNRSFKHVMDKGLVKVF